VVHNEHRFRVIYGDTDMMGIVYYANYLRYFEAGRTELLRSLDFSYRLFEEAGYAMPVVEANVRYRAPSTYDDLLCLETSVSEVRASSVKIEYRLVRDEDELLICTGMTRHACLSDKGQVIRWPEMFTEKVSGS